MIKGITWCSAMVVLAAACTPSSGASGHEEDVAAIVEATAQWNATFERGDIDALMTFLTPEARFVPPDQPVVSGAAAIDPWIRAVFGAMTFENVAQTIDSVRVAGDWAVSRGGSVITVSAEGAMATDTLRSVLIWERQTDGSWKIAHDIWNFTHPLPFGG